MRFTFADRGDGGCPGDGGRGLVMSETGRAGTSERRSTGAWDMDPDDARSYYVHGTKAVEILRKMEGDVGTGRFGDREAVLAMTLGFGLMTFDLLDSGLWSHEVCRFTLGMLEHGYHSSSSERKEGIWTHRVGATPMVDAGLVPFVCMDVFNCVVSRQMPLCRLEMGAMGHDEAHWVDRYIGLCGPILAVLFDICRLSYQLGTLGTSSQSRAGRTRAEILAELEDIANTVLSWDPRILESFALASAPEDVRRLRAQASIYRTTTLLTIHRLRYGFGERDDDARQLSQTIFAEIDGIDACTRSPDGQSGNAQADCRLRFPFFIAAVEVVDRAERIQALNKLRAAVWSSLYPQATGRLGHALTAVWYARDWERCTHWFDLASTTMPPFVLF